MSEKQKLAGMASRAERDAAYDRLYDQSQDESGTVDTDVFVEKLALYLRERNSARNWVKEAATEKDLFFERKKSRREPNQPALIQVDCIYALGKYVDEKGVEKFRTTKARDMTVAQALLHIEFREKYMREIVQDTEMDLAPFRRIVAASPNANARVVEVAERLGIKMPADGEQPRSLPAVTERQKLPHYDETVPLPPVM